MVAKMAALVDAVILENIESLLRIPHGEADLSRSFMALGGSSIDAVALSQKCKEYGVFISVTDILRQSSLVALLATALSQTDCRSLGQKPKAIDGSTLDFSNPKYKALRYPMTEMQFAFIQGSRNNPGTNIIRHQQTCTPDQAPILKKAWQTVLEGEPIFRTEFYVQDGTGYLVETDHSPFQWEEVTAQSEEEYVAILEEFPTMSEVTSKFKLVRQQYNGSEATACIIWSVHHALIDGFSMQILLEKVERSIRGQPVSPGPSFACLAAGLEQLRHSRRDQGLEFWNIQKERFPNASDVVLLPPPSEPSTNSHCITRSVRPTIMESQLQSYATSLGVTKASIYLAAWGLALSQFNDADTVVFGVVFSCRDLDLPRVTEAVGSLANTLPLHLSLDRAQATTEFLEMVFKQMLELSAFQWTTPEHGFSRQFSSAIAMQFASSMTQEVVGAAGHTSKTLINSDIPLSIMIEADGIIEIHGLSTQFNAAQVGLLAQQYANTVAAVCEPYHTLGMCLERLLSLPLRQRLLEFGNCHSGLTTETSVQEDLVTLFERTVTNHPSEIALEHNDQRMTYQELDHKSSQLAYYLKNTLHVKNGDVVCVLADQSIFWIVAIYGILKVGGVYCALNQNLTSDLLSSAFESSGSRVFLIPGNSIAPTRPNTCENLAIVAEILYSVTGDTIDTCTLWKRRKRPQPAAAAYLCFTSGSTGKAKGVLCSHRGLVAFQRNLEVRLFASPGRKVAQIMSVSFDGSIHEIFSALSYGATLVLPKSADPFAHLREVDSAILTPSVARVLHPADFPALQHVYLVGEPVPQNVNDLWGASKQLYNMYGPTEATCGATIKRLIPGEPVTLGHCNPSTRVYILNKRKQLVLPGVIGQIHLAGVQVSYGYLNLSDATSTHFFDDSICSGLGERMYATGDFGYWNDRGELVCLGRNDRQIKLRGFRLDFDDLEARILRIPGVTASAVMQKDDYLVAVLQPGSLHIDDVWMRLASILPPHAMPKSIIAVDQFPMTAAGKRDYKQLLALVELVKVSKSDNLTTLEKKIAHVWTELLHAPGTLSITPYSNLLELGGHSLLQLRLASRLSTMFGCEISARTIIQSDTLRGLAHVIEGMTVDNDSSTESSRSSSPTKNGTIIYNHLSPIETEWMIKYRMDCGTTAFNVSLAFQVNDPTIRSRLIDAWNQVLERHQILRSRYIQRRTGTFRRAFCDHSPRVQLVRSFDLSNEVNQPFYLDREHPIRVFCTQDAFLIVVTHAVCDLTTMQLLLDEVETIYRGGKTLLSDRPYMGSSTWARKASDEDMQFWSHYTENIPPAHFSLLPRFGCDRQNYHGSSLVIAFSCETTHLMNRYAEQASITLHQLSLAAVALALHPTSKKFDMLLGAPNLNRPSLHDMETLGLFLEPLAIRVQSPEEQDPSVLSFLQSIKRSSQAALAHAVPWTDLWEYLNGETDFPNHPLFDVMVTFHDKQHSLSLALEGVQPLYTWSQGSKFKLMFEFSAISDDTTLLRIEYDDSLFTTCEILRVGMLVWTALDLLVRDTDWSVLKADLEQALAVEPNGAWLLDPMETFGASIANLDAKVRNMCKTSL